MKIIKAIIIGIVGFLSLFAVVMLGFFTLAGIDKALGAGIDSERAVDGSYMGHYRSGPNRAEVKVTITSGAIGDIEVIRNVGSWIGKAATDKIPERIVASQSTNVDAVTGATRSSVVIMNAVNAAIEKSYENQAEKTD